MKTLLKNPANTAMILLGATVLIAVVLAVINVISGQFQSHIAI